MKKTDYFGLKSYFSHSPIKFVVNALFLFLPLFTLLIRICERKLSILDPSIGFDKFVNCLWWTVVTMTTIGYGDLYPRTVPGRIIAFFVSIWGSLFVSFMVVAFTSFTDIEHQERRAFWMIKKMDARDELNDKAASFIGAFYRVYLKYKKYHGNLSHSAVDHFKKV